MIKEKGQLILKKEEGKEEKAETLSDHVIISGYGLGGRTLAKVLEEAQNVDETQAGRGQIHARTAASVMYCADMCNKVLDSALQIHGGSGYIWESEINRLFRSTKLLEIGAGTTEVRKMIISGEVLAS